MTHEEIFREEARAALAKAGHLAELSQKKHLNASEVHALYGWSPRLLQDWRSNGRGPRYVQEGRNVYYRHEDLQEFASRNAVRTYDAQ